MHLKNILWVTRKIMRKYLGKSKKAQMWEHLLPLLIALAIAVVVIMFIWLKYKPTGDNFLKVLGFRK